MRDVNGNNVCRMCRADVPLTGKKGRPREFCAGCSELPRRAKLAPERVEAERAYQREYKRRIRGSRLWKGEVR